jgi:hypothetical protein
MSRLQFLEKAFSPAAGRKNFVFAILLNSKMTKTLSQILTERSDEQGIFPRQ